MKHFVAHALLYILTTVLMAWGLSWFAGPYMDAYYLKVTTPRQKSLVVGSSKAAQGIIPEIINKTFEEQKISIGLYNYAFTVKSSSFGEPYLQSILRKIDKSIAGNADRLYILAVDPWSISTISLKETQGKTLYLDWNFPPNNIRYNTLNPNPEYVFKNVDNRFMMIIRKFRPLTYSKVRSDGSLEVLLKRDTTATKKDVAGRLEEYRQNARLYTFSEERYKYLGITIDSLSTYGHVFLVRIPVHPDMRALEDNFMKDFAGKMDTICRDHQAVFLDYPVDATKFVSTDGNHLDRKSAELFSGILARQLVEHLKKK